MSRPTLRAPIACSLGPRERSPTPASSRSFQSLAGPFPQTLLYFWDIGPIAASSIMEVYTFVLFRFVFFVFQEKIGDHSSSAHVYEMRERLGLR